MSKFKSGDKVYIKSYDSNLEYDVMYTVHMVQGLWLSVKTDELRYLSFDKFMSLQEYRNQKIKKIKEKYDI